MAGDPTVGATFIQAAHVSAGNNLPATRIVIHGTVSLTMLGGALQIAHFFTLASAGGSAHYVVDPAQVVGCVREAEIAWHAPPNAHSIGWEFCDMVAWDPRYPNGFPNEAAWHGRWSLPAWDAMLRLGAAGVRADALRLGVPMARIGVGQLLAGAHGICGHIDVSQAWHQTDHTDPGPDFPWDRFMGYVTNPPGGFLMALTDQQQTELAANVSLILHMVQTGERFDNAASQAMERQPFIYSAVQTSKIDTAASAEAAHAVTAAGTAAGLLLALEAVAKGGPGSIDLAAVQAAAKAGAEEAIAGSIHVSGTVQVDPTP